MNTSGQKAGERKEETGERANGLASPLLSHADLVVFDASDADGGLVTTWLHHRAGPSEDRGPNCDIHLVPHLAESQPPGAA